MIPERITSFSGPYAFLSNFYPHVMKFEGFEWKTAEHAFQAQKTESPKRQSWIRNAETPGQAKRMGRSVELREDWDEVKDDCMYQVLKAKFSDPELQKKLLDTGDAHLEEGNTWGDRYWGTVNGQGENMLGRLLMVIRHDLANPADGDLHGH